MHDPLLELNSLDKKALELRAQQYLSEFNGEIKSVGKDLKSLSTSTLIVGGVFLAAFFIGKKLFKNKKPKPFNDPDLNQLVVKYPKSESPIVRMIKEHITIFLISLIKEKLINYLTETEKKHEPVR
jgi:hypothetical protein